MSSSIPKPITMNPPISDTSAMSETMTSTIPNDNPKEVGGEEGEGRKKSRRQQKNKSTNQSREGSTSALPSVDPYLGGNDGAHPNDSADVDYSGHEALSSADVNKKNSIGGGSKSVTPKKNPPSSSKRNKGNPSANMNNNGSNQSIAESVAAAFQKAAAAATASFAKPSPSSTPALHPNHHPSRHQGNSSAHHKTPTKHGRVQSVNNLENGQKTPSKSGKGHQSSHLHAPLYAGASFERSPAASSLPKPVFDDKDIGSGDTLPSNLHQTQPPPQPYSSSSSSASLFHHTLPIPVPSPAGFHYPQHGHQPMQHQLHHGASSHSVGYAQTSWPAPTSFDPHSFPLANGFAPTFPYPMPNGPVPHSSYAPHVLQTSSHPHHLSSQSLSSSAPFMSSSLPPHLTNSIGLPHSRQPSQHFPHHRSVSSSASTSSRLDGSSNPFAPQPYPNPASFGDPDIEQSEFASSSAVTSSPPKGSSSSSHVMSLLSQSLASRGSVAPGVAQGKGTGDGQALGEMTSSLKDLLKISQSGQPPSGNGLH